MLQADLAGRSQLAEALNAQVPESWPPVNWERGPIEFLLNWMQKRPDVPGWFAWYCLLRKTDCQTGSSSNQLGDRPNKASKRQAGGISCNTLIGGLGFLGPPNVAGETEMGYSLLSDFHRRGYCPEALSSLVDWAFSHSELKMLIIRTLPRHRPSIRVAEKLGFQFVGSGAESDTVEYALDRAGWIQRQADKAI
jgi:RimJ/RimL family protein N-acetyltransferase